MINFVTALNVCFGYSGHSDAFMHLLPPNVLADQRLTIADRSDSAGRQWSNGW